LRRHERQRREGEEGSTETEEVRVKFEISLPLSGYTCRVTSQLSQWVDKAAKKIQTLPLPKVHSLALEKIAEAVQIHACDFTSQCVRLCHEELSSADNFVQNLEDHYDHLLLKAAPKAKPASSRNEVSTDDLDVIFTEADQDEDGHISRSEWRRLMAQREDIITTANADKAKLIEENNRLRLALYPGSEFAYGHLHSAEAARARSEQELNRKEAEVARLKAEVSLCEQQLLELERFTDKERYEQYKKNTNSGDFKLRLNGNIGVYPTSTFVEKPFIFEEEKKEKQRERDIDLYELAEEDEDSHAVYDYTAPLKKEVLSSQRHLPDSTFSVPDHYGLFASQQRLRFVDELLNSPVYSKEEATSWVKQEAPVVDLTDEYLQVPPSLNEVTTRQASSHVVTTTNSAPSPQVLTDRSQHPLHKALMHNTKSLDLSPLPTSARQINARLANSSPLKGRVPRKSFKDHTTSSRGRQLPAHTTGLFHGVRSPANWTNSQEL